jgi:hypothetical protein
MSGTVPTDLAFKCEARNNNSEPAVMAAMGPAYCHIVSPELLAGLG